MKENRVFDDLTRLFADAGEVAHGVRREAETALRAQFERAAQAMNFVTREEFEAVREMAARARDENERLRARIETLEAQSTTARRAEAGS